MSTEKVGRIAGCEYANQRPQALAVFNSQYTIDGKLCGAFSKPWTVVGANAYEEFDSHAEALAWAFKKSEAGK